jgi:hypothetical protein
VLHLAGLSLAGDTVLRGAMFVLQDGAGAAVASTDRGSVVRIASLTSTTVFTFPCREILERITAGRKCCRRLTAVANLRHVGCEINKTR